MFSFPTFMCVIAALSSAPINDEHTALKAQIEQLQQRVAALTGEREEHWLNQRRSDELRSLVHDVITDADSRSQLVSSNVTAGHDGSFFIGSTDGHFRLNLSGLAQFRYVYNYQGDPGGDGDRHRSGFENRRTQLIFFGHLVDPTWTFRFHGDAGRTGQFSLQNAYIEKRLSSAWSFRAGQFRPRFLMEESTSSGRQLAVDRSLVNGAFRQGWMQGLYLHGQCGESVRLAVGVYDGMPTTTGRTGDARSRPWNDADSSEYTFIGSVETLLAGNWRQFREFTSWADDPFAAMIGAALAWQRDQYGTSDPVTEMLRWTVDASVKFGGAHAFAAFIGNHERTIGAGSVDQFGLVVQGGVHIVPDQWELFGRYEWGTTDGMGSDLSLLTLGVNRYFARHNLKLVTDVSYGFNPVESFWALSSAGWRADVPGERGQVVLRSQLQLLF